MKVHFNPDFCCGLFLPVLVVTSMQLRGKYIIIDHSRSIPPSVKLMANPHEFKS